MNPQTQLQIWDLWYPQAASTGVAFARGRLDATNILLVHAAPPMLTVEVRSDDGKRLAYAQDLAQTADRPMARLTVQGGHITRADVWPTPEDVGRPVILSGGDLIACAQTGTGKTAGRGRSAESLAPRR